MQGKRPARQKPTRHTMSALRMAVKFCGGQNKDLADSIGVSKTLVGNWCNGKYAMSLNCAVLIEKYTKGAIKAVDLLPGLSPPA